MYTNQSLLHYIDFIRFNKSLVDKKAEKCSQIGLSQHRTSVTFIRLYYYRILY